MENSRRRKGKPKKNPMGPHMALVKQVRSIVKHDRFLEKELKYLAIVDSTYGAITWNGTDFFQQLTAVPQGDTDSQRDGDQITLNGFDFVVGVKTGTTTPTFLRLILFQWHPNSTPTYASILIDQHNTSNAALSQYNHDQRQQFHILWDHHVMTNASTITAHYIHHRCTKGFSPRIQFVGGSTTVSTNAIYLMVVSDVAANGPTVVFSCKTTFYDS